MANVRAIYTEITQCQDCYKCVRACPVKAIRVENSSAIVMSDNCVLCGNCVEVCPVGAKKVRSDTSVIKNLLNSGKEVIVSLAPSYAGEFEDVSAAQIISALKKLGFAEVSETALGAEIVSKHVKESLAKESSGLFISSACPVVVEFLMKYRKEKANNITKIYSPLLTHAKTLKQIYGDNCAVVFIGPCIAKKEEADRLPELIDAVIGFSDLRLWFEEEGIRPELIYPKDDAVFKPTGAGKGSLYPIDGGMISGIKDAVGYEDTTFMAFSGLKNIDRVLAGIDKAAAEKKIFLELLACEGGCVNGPLTSERSKTAFKRIRILENQGANSNEAFTSDIDINDDFSFVAIESPDYSEQEIKDTLAKVGKYSKNDELNCGGCGYDNCRNFAKAMLDGKAESGMCVSYMRKSAQRKANALLKKIPLAVFIADENMKIHDSNIEFAKLFSQTDAYEGRPGLEGASLKKILDENLLNAVENSIKSDKSREISIMINARMIRAYLFAVEKGRFSAAVFMDETAPAALRQTVADTARKLMQKNLNRVKEMAEILGESAAESEEELTRIISMTEGGKDE